MAIRDPHGTSRGSLPRRATALCTLLLTLSSSSCYRIPRVTSNGQPLEARSDCGSWRDRKGKKHTSCNFQGYFQGGTMVDEQDFFTIAGDKAAAEQIEQERAGDTATFIGTSLGTLASIALGVVGIVMIATNPTPGPNADGIQPEPPPAQQTGRWLTAPAFVGILALGGWAIYSASKLWPFRYVFATEGSSERGDQAAESYNLELERKTGASLEPVPADAPLPSVSARLLPSLKF